MIQKHFSKKVLGEKFQNLGKHLKLKLTISATKMRNKEGKECRGFEHSF